MSMSSTKNLEVFQNEPIVELIIKGFSLLFIVHRSFIFIKEKG